MIWGNPDLNVGSASLDSNSVGILNLVYQFINLPFNIFFMALTIWSKDGWDESFMSTVQIATFVNIGISFVSWVSLSLIPYLIYYFDDSTSAASQLIADSLWWGTLMYQIVGPLNVLAPVFFYFYTILWSNSNKDLSLIDKYCIWQMSQVINFDLNVL